MTQQRWNRYMAEYQIISLGEIQVLSSTYNAINSKRGVITYGSIHEKVVWLIFIVNAKPWKVTYIHAVTLRDGCRHCLSNQEKDTQAGDNFQVELHLETGTRNWWIQVQETYAVLILFFLPKTSVRGLILYDRVIYSLFNCRLNWGSWNISCQRQVDDVCQGKMIFFASYRNLKCFAGNWQSLTWVDASDRGGTIEWLNQLTN